MNNSKESMHPINPSFIGDRGLTKREYFSAMAMQGFCTFRHVSSELAAKHAVEYADALLKELDK